MEKPHASLSLSLQEGRLEIAGSEEFVEKQIERFSDLINRLSTEAVSKTDRTVAIPPAGAEAKPAKQAADAYAHVFAMANDQLKITKPINGGTTAEKTVRLAQLVLLGNALNGIEEVSFDTIRQTCKDHGFLDSGNFASTIKDEKELFVCAGSGRRQNAKLTPGGRKKAETLASELNVVE